MFDFEPFDNGNNIVEIDLLSGAVLGPAILQSQDLIFDSPRDGKKPISIPVKQDPIHINSSSQKKQAQKPIHIHSSMAKKQVIVSSVKQEPGLWHFSNVCFEHIGRRPQMKLFGDNPFINKTSKTALDIMSRTWLTFVHGDELDIAVGFPHTLVNETTIVLFCHPNPAHVLKDQLLNVAQALMYGRKYPQRFQLSSWNCRQEWNSGVLDAFYNDHSVGGKLNLTEACFRHAVLPKAKHLRYSYDALVPRQRRWKGLWLERGYTSIPRVPNYKGIFSHRAPYVCAWIRDKVLRFYDKLQKPRSLSMHRSMFVYNREDAPRRVWANSRDFINRTMNLYEGVLNITLSSNLKISFSEQLELFSKIDIAVMPHGGGVINAVFAPPGAIFVEFSCNGATWLGGEANFDFSIYVIKVICRDAGDKINTAHDVRKFNTTEGFLDETLEEILGAPSKPEMSNNSTKSKIRESRVIRFKNVVKIPTVLVEGPVIKLSVIVHLTPYYKALRKGFFFMYEKYLLAKSKAFRLQVQTFACMSSIEESSVPAYVIPLLYNEKASFGKNEIQCIENVKYDVIIPIPSTSFIIRPTNFTDLYLATDSLMNSDSLSLYILDQETGIKLWKRKDYLSSLENGGLNSSLSAPSYSVNNVISSKAAVTKDGRWNEVQWPGICCIVNSLELSVEAHQLGENRLGTCSGEIQPDNDESRLFTKDGMFCSF